MHPSSPSASLSSLYLESVADFDRLCSLLGSESISAMEFRSILRGCDLSVDGQVVFDCLLSMCREAESIAGSYPGVLAWTRSKALQANRLDVDALRNLYAYHPSYTICEDPVDTARDLTDHVKCLFNLSVSESSVSMNSETTPTSLNRQGTLALLKHLLPSDDYGSEEKKKMNESDFDDELDMTVDAVMAMNHQKLKHEEQALDLETIASLLLRYQNKQSLSTIDPATLFDGQLHEKIFDPLQTSSEDFVATLDAVALNHDALRHHCLVSLSMGSWGGLRGTLSKLADFMQAYRHFTSTFCHHLETTIGMVGSVDPSKHLVEVLEENAEEERGIYDEEDIEMIKALGLDANLLRNVPHKDLYLQCYWGLRRLSNDLESLTEEQCSFIAKPLVTAFQAACNPSEGATAATGIAAMYLGSELIVANMYSKLSNYLLTFADKMPNSPVTRQDLAFFLLHIDMDVDHADKMREIVVCLATDEATRLKMASAVDAVFRARLDFCDRFMEVVFPPTGHGGENSAKLYNQQSQNWVRKDATCLSDFTGRPIVFDLCRPFVEGANVLDVGCGEGYGARKLATMGAKKIIGLDVSEEMIQRAKENPMRSACETYETCDAENICVKLMEIPATLGLVPGRMLEEGCFDLAIAIFLFNYTSIRKMKTICQQIYQALKPGGHFVFSVPHPFMIHTHGSNSGNSDATFSFARGDVAPESYFSLRDRKFAGNIRTLDGRNLNVKMLFKSISDYTETLQSVGFVVEKLHECRVLPEHVAAHPKFFNSIRDSPLHMVFHVVKPLAAKKIPRAIEWSSFEKANADRIKMVTIPESVLTELVDFSKEAWDRGVTEETFCPTTRDAQRLANVAAFGTNLRSRLVSGSGVVHLCGSEFLKRLCATDQNTTIGRVKLAYYVLSSLIGRVDGTLRGRLFDVHDQGLEATVADNVLFSVSNDPAPYHTDGASADRSYDAVGLLCLQPASEGGTLHLSHAGGALATLWRKLPIFLRNELFRPLPRDILERDDSLLRFSRNPELLALRVRHNAYPIFETDSNFTRLRFRYMRHWINSGHSKANLPLSPLLSLAMDALDASLDNETVASIRMQPGDMVFCNNSSFAHARDAFRDEVGPLHRHKVRVWLKLRGYE